MINNHKLIVFRTVYIVTMLMLSLLMFDVIINSSIKALVYLFCILGVTVCYVFLRRKSPFSLFFGEVNSTWFPNIQFSEF